MRLLLVVAVHGFFVPASAPVRIRNTPVGAVARPGQQSAPFAPVSHAPLGLGLLAGALGSGVAALFVRSRAAQVSSRHTDLDSRALPLATATKGNFFEQMNEGVEYNKKMLGKYKTILFDRRKATAAHILFGLEKYGDEAFANATILKARLASGDISFDDAVVEFSTCPSKGAGGKLAEFPRGRMVDDFDVVCFDEETPLNEVVGPVKTRFGYHLIKVLERTS